MAEFTSKRSVRVLSELSAALWLVNTKAIKHIDYSLIDGSRTTNQQVARYAQGRTAPGRIVTFVDGINDLSRHQVTPEDPLTHAFDFIPAPFTYWEDQPVFTAYAHFIIGIGYEHGIELRWGGDWDQDFRWRDQKFNDYPHIEEVIQSKFTLNDSGKVPV